MYLLAERKAVHLSFAFIRSHAHAYAHFIT